MQSQRPEVSLTRRLMAAVVTPLLLLLGVGVVLALLVARMMNTMRSVDHSDAVLAQVYNLKRSLLDEESSLRGYLMTDDRTFWSRSSAGRRRRRSAG